MRPPWHTATRSEPAGSSSCATRCPRAGESGAIVAATIWLGYGLERYAGHTEEIARGDLAHEPDELAEERR